MTIKERLQQALKEAMKAKDSATLSALRLIHAAIRQREIDERIDLTDEQTIIVLDKLMKQRRESIKQYSEAGREDLAAKETFEADIIQAFLPESLSEAEIDQLIEAAFAVVGVVSIKEMGKVMAIVKPQVQGRADMTVVSQKIKQKLPD